MVVVRSVGLGGGARVVNMFIGVLVVVVVIRFFFASSSSCREILVACNCGRRVLV